MAGRYTLAFPDITLQAKNLVKPLGRDLLFGRYVGLVAHLGQLLFEHLHFLAELRPISFLRRSALGHNLRIHWIASWGLLVGDI